MVAIELGTCRSGRTGSAPRLEACGERRCLDPLADEALLRGEKAALGDQKAVGCDAQAGMMGEAAPVAAIVVAKAKLLLEFMIVPLDPPARLGNPHETLERGAPREVGEPVLGRLGVSRRPLDQQPLFGPGFAAPRVAMRRTHPHGREARTEFAVRARAPGHAVPVLRRQAERQRLERDRLVLRIAPQPGRAPATAGPWGRRQWSGAGRPDAGAGARAEHVAQAEVGNANAEVGLVTIGGI